MYGPVVADNAVMAGKNYALSRGAMRNLSEAVDRIRLDEFKETNPAIFESVEHIIPDILTSVKAAEDPNQVSRYRDMWKLIHENLKKYNFHEMFSRFNENMGKDSELWQYWNIFLMI